MSNHIQGVSGEEFDAVGGRDDLTHYMVKLICDDEWQIPDCFLEKYSMWDLINQDLEVEGYVLVLEDYDWDDNAGPGLSFGRYGLRLDQPRGEVRDYARILILNACRE